LSEAESERIVASFSPLQRMKDLLAADHSAPARRALEGCIIAFVRVVVVLSLVFMCVIPSSHNRLTSVQQIEARQFRAEDY
jgi:hypothetical protein